MTPSRVSAGRYWRRTIEYFAMCRRLITAAIAAPSSTASTRSRKTVASSVMTKVFRSARVVWKMVRNTAGFTIRSATTTRTPPSAASGIRDTTGPSASMITSSRTAWVTEASRVRPPERTLTAVRAIAPVAGNPPNRPDARLARP